MTDLTVWISQRRFDEYMVAANQDIESARELYEWNVAISAAFFELISHVETALRNAVDKILQPLEVSETARVKPQQGWWFASSTFLTDHDLDFHAAARRHLGRNADTASRDKMLAAMTFGIWEAVFGPSYEQLFRKHLFYAFPNKGARFTRETVQKNVLALRNLRNRIAHHQAIFDLPLEERFEQAMELLRWIDPKLEQWVSGLCRVRDLLNVRPKSAESIAVIVSDRESWNFYQQHGVYICQPGRYFRQVSHIGFYADSAVQSELPKVLERIDDVNWASDEIGRRMGLKNEREKRIAEVIRDSRALGWTNDRYQLFLLTRPGKEGRTKGHETLDAPLPRVRTGKGSAWVRRQRYVAVPVLQSAKSLGDVDQQ
ncbi:Abi-like protein [Mycobacteroides abscessus subsp. abscessus]|nr:Abi-like protein [Mycobacteroides abscessus subsp. abscessus]